MRHLLLSALLLGCVAEVADPADASSPAPPPLCTFVGPVCVPTWELDDGVRYVWVPACGPNMTATCFPDGEGLSYTSDETSWAPDCGEDQIPRCREGDVFAEPGCYRAPCTGGPELIEL